MSKAVSMAEIARIFNVSKVTVSKALNDQPGVSEALREEIKQKADELGLRLNSAARNLKTSKSYNIGVLIAERFVGDSHAYYLQVYGKISVELVSLGYSCILEYLNANDEKMLKLPLMYRDSKIDALIVLGQLDNCYLNLLSKISIPLLFVDFYDYNIDVDTMTIDNFKSGYQITQHLIDMGHKEIGFIGNIYSTSSIQDRFLGFYRAILTNKLHLNYEHVHSDRDENGSFLNIKIPNNLPSALVCNNDQVAYYVIKKLIASGYRVPEDISVVAFDNSIFSTVSNPQITTIDNNLDEFVSVACKVIIKKLTANNKRYGRILIDGKIIYRDSVRRKNE